MTTEQVTHAERLEAHCRHAMATLPPATWERRAERSEQLERIDMLLDEYLDAR